MEECERPIQELYNCYLYLPNCRLELQARRQVERSGTSESLCDSRRSSELARRFNSLYNDRVSDLLDQLDLVVKWTEDDLNQFALDLFKVGCCFTAHCYENSVCIKWASHVPLAQNFPYYSSFS